MKVVKNIQMYTFVAPNYIQKDIYNWDVTHF